MIGRAPCGCPITHKGATVHRIQCSIRVGTPRVFPPTPAEVTQARLIIWEAYTEIQNHVRTMASRGVHQTNYAAAEIDRSIEWIKQRLHVIALARSVLPSDDGKANT